MYVLVHHTIRDPAGFWTAARELIPQSPAELRLHQTLAATDGTLATCLWEADSIDLVREYVERSFGGVSINEYREAENRVGVAVPSRFSSAAPPSA